ncbi:MULTISPECIES: LamG domain-containing protein [unclassified Chryseobacterium]|uniref:LamG domain-containing protein n=1 Tax=unclassified Chryseobacterium TaxID=2593645 RepID=UPI0021E59690|nr:MULTISPECIES: LamG domain-containing protein [unclassified Chryseobacterium]MEA1851143.1 LamG domain-containing protein [Chryseobacterium sp. MHB01]
MKNINLIKYIAAAFLFSITAISCEDSIDKDNPPIPYSSIGGYQNSDEVASGNLVAKLSFENNLSDKINNITGQMPQGVAYTSGVKGMAYNGSSSEMKYSVANATTAITGLNSFTIAFWMKSDGTVDPATPGQGKGAQGIFTIVRPTEFWGGINLFLENPDASKPNRIRLKLGVENSRTGVSWKGQGVIANLDGYKGKWVHIVFAYDASTSKCYVYQDGEAAKNLDGFAYSPAGGELGGAATWFASDPGGASNPANAPGYGNFQMGGTNGKVVFGSHQFETVPPQNNGSQQDWATSYAGQLDEFRIYNVALKSSDVIALYKLEKDGR